jgi:hypothetical protein
MVALKRKANTTKLLRKTGTAALTTDPKCCCGPFVAINICNFNKWSDEIHDAVLNGHTLTQPTVHANGACGGGYYANVSPLPAYCGLQTTGGTKFQCCGSQVGGSCGGTNYPAGVYPATGAANEDTCASPKSSNQQNCGTLGDCSGDLITQSFPSSYLVTGTNTLTVNRTGATRSAGSYGVVQVAKLEIASGVWRINSFLASGTYGSGNLTLTWNL